VKDFLDYRTAPQPGGGFAGAVDFSHLVPGEGHADRFLYGIGKDDIGIVHAVRSQDGTLSVLAWPSQFEPVMDGEQLIGLRFPGSDRYPVQPWDEERDA
jgi:hypothetical protein